MAHHTPRTQRRSRPELHRLVQWITRMRAWLAVVGVFYATWVAFATFGGRWTDVVAHWPMAVAMAAGSFFAGSTPMGGGTVGFPMMVLVFHLPVTLGRDFSFLIQSIGMVSASAFIVASRTPVAWRLLRWSMLSSFVCTPLGILFIAPVLPASLTKLVFAVICCSFGILHLARVPDIEACVGTGTHSARWDRAMGIAIGFIGGAGLGAATGVGIDMLLYVVVVAGARMDIKIAVPTSVIIMAFTSVVGAGTLIGTSRLDPNVWGYWWAAAPVVALGAPLGALVVQRIPRRKTLYVVSGLLVLQFIWTCIDGRVTGLPLAASLGSVAFVYGGFKWMFDASGESPELGATKVHPEFPGGAALRDNVSGALSRAAFMEQASGALSNAVRYERSLSVVVIDFAFPKGSTPPAVADAELRAITNAIKDATREGDAVGRIEEFRLAICMEADAAGANEFVRRVRERLDLAASTFSEECVPRFRFAMATKAKGSESSVDALLTEARRAIDHRDGRDPLPA